MPQVGTFLVGVVDLLILQDEKYMSYWLTLNSQWVTTIYLVSNSKRDSELMTIEFIDNRNSFFEDVKALGRKNSATLGFMPEGGCENYVKNRNNICNFANKNYE